MLFFEYLNIFYYLLFAMFFSSLLLGVSSILDFFLFYKKYYDFEKVSSYECGFQPFSDARSVFDIRFYLVAILFIIFDLELIFLAPWALVFQEVGISAFWSMLAFLLILTIGFVYEWVKGALDWQ